MKYRHFGKVNQKRALLKGLVLNVFKTGGIATYRTRGKDAQKLIDNIINLGKKADVNSKRRIAKLLSADKDMIAHIEQVAQNFTNRPSGYTRIVRLGQRRGDASEMVRLEWVVELKNTEKKEKEVKKSKPKVTRSTKTEEGAPEVATA